MSERLELDDGLTAHERLVRAAEESAAAEKARIAKERGWEPNDRRLLFALLKRYPGEGKIERNEEGCSFTIFYTPEMIEDVAKRRPWALAELMKELNGGRQ